VAVTTVVQIPPTTLQKLISARLLKKLRSVSGNYYVKTCAVNPNGVDEFGEDNHDPDAANTGANAGNTFGIPLSGHDKT